MLGQFDVADSRVTADMRQAVMVRELVATSIRGFNSGGVTEKLGGVRKLNEVRTFLTALNF